MRMKETAVSYSELSGQRLKACAEEARKACLQQKSGLDRVLATGNEGGRHGRRHSKQEVTNMDGSHWVRVEDEQTCGFQYRQVDREAEM